MKLTLLGTTTSPYVRKVRILLGALGWPHTLLDTREPAGADRLRAVAPLGKVPVLLADDRVLPDSSAITHWLWLQAEAEVRRAGFVLDPTDWDDRALQLVVEGTLDAAINRFYLLKDGMPDTGYVRKQGDRVQTTLSWLDGRVTFRHPVGLANLSLGCMLDWMAFRSVVDLQAWPGLHRYRQEWLAAGVGAGTEPG